MDALDFIDGITALAHPDEEMLYGFVQGRLSPDRAKAIGDHVTRCPHCRELSEMFGCRQSAEIVSLPVGAKNTGARPRTADQVPSVVWRSAEAEPLAASDAEALSEGRRASAIKADLVQLIPGVADGGVALGYLCEGGVDVVVTGLGDRPARVLLNDVEYEVRNGAANEPRVVEGLTRKHVAIWLAGGPRGRFQMLYP